MTPTEQDKMSDEELYQSITDICFESGGVTKPMADKLMQLITADRKRVALEARLNEVQNAYEHWINGRKFISSYFRDRIAVLSDTKESKDE